MNFKMSVDLTPDQIKEIITNSIEKSVPTHKVVSVHFKVEASYDMMDRPNGYSHLTGVEVELEPKVTEKQQFTVRGHDVQATTDRGGR